MATGDLLEVGGKFGEYDVLRLLGKGGMGEVYLIRGASGHEYAVKVMAVAAEDEDSRKRFAREAAVAMEIAHPNLVRVYDIGEDPDTGLCYIIMEHIAGGNVTDRLASRGRFKVNEAVAVTAQIASALEAAHQKGVIHRDIKPDNIMFDDDGKPRLADLGIAKVTGGDRSATLTETGMMIGTPAYMSPEQMIDSRLVDARSDIYSLGLVLYEMLAGRRANADATVVEILAKAIKGEEIPDVRSVCADVPEALARLVARMCAPRKEDRPATAAEVVALLKRCFAGGRSGRARMGAALAWRWTMAPTRLRRRIAFGAATLALAVLSAAAGAWRTAARLGAETADEPLPVVRYVDVERLVTNAVYVARTDVRTVAVQTNFYQNVRTVTNVVEVAVVLTNFVAGVETADVAEEIETEAEAAMAADADDPDRLKDKAANTKGYRLRYARDGKGVTIIGIIPKKYAGKVDIPDRMGGAPVVRIGANAFNGCRLTEVSIPAGVTSIGNSAFRDCYHLRYVRFWGECPKADFGIFANVRCCVIRVPRLDSWRSIGRTTWQGLSVVM